MLSEKFGHPLDKPFAAFARKIPLSPNSLTVIGFVLVIMCAPVLASDLKLGALLLLPACIFDMLDGLVARVQGKSSAFGALLDSVIDRYSDSVILLAIAWNLGSAGNRNGVILSLITLTGALIISYVRAKAESLGVSASNGLMERTERLLVLFFGAVSGFMVQALFVLAVLTHVTVLQRIFFARNQLRRLH